ncbi:MAG: alanine:cation symporter family protein [Myxococcales bacterium]|nr:alanine:cation symporter family protein [Myxococcales bacterium]
MFRSPRIAALSALAVLAAAAPAHAGFEESMDQFFGEWLVGPIASVLFWPIPGINMPIVVAWLGLGALYFTLRMGFVNFRMFGHAIALVRGKYDSPDAEGEVSHFQALTAALSATVGLGNIAGVAIAVSMGGPGATFWMIVAGLLGMTAKFSEVTLGQKYRKVRPDGSVMGGAMYYLSDGLAEMGLKGLGKVLAIAFTVLCILGSFGGGNSFQVKQSLDQIRLAVPFLDANPWVYGAVMVVLVGIVIIGGIRRIASVADKVVPAMVTIYVLAAAYILAVNASEIPTAFRHIFEGAFNPTAVGGGIVGVLVQGIKRAAFSNEAGVGSAAIAHAAAKVDYPVQEGIVALLEPFIDTVVVCTMTALVIVITGAYDTGNPLYADLIASNQGAALTSKAMGSVISWFPTLLSVAVLLFAYSTMISWSYYGERCWTWLFGEGTTLVYRLLFLTFTFLGSVVTATNILDFSDLMILGMSVPNVLGVALMSGVVARELSSYQAKLKSGEVKRTS